MFWKSITDHRGFNNGPLLFDHSITNNLVWKYFSNLLSSSLVFLKGPFWGYTVAQFIRTRTGHNRLFSPVGLWFFYCALSHICVYYCEAQICDSNDYNFQIKKLMTIKTNPFSTHVNLQCCFFDCYPYTLSSTIPPMADLTIFHIDLVIII